MNDKIAKKFNVPEVARPYLSVFLNPYELVALELMEERPYSLRELAFLLDNILSSSFEDFVRSSYSRGFLNKAEDNGDIFYRFADFYTRLAFFAQYEQASWMEIPEETRRSIDNWCVGEYVKKASPRLEAALKGETLIENAFFYTLEESLNLIDSLDFDPYMVPCNCKSIALKCAAPRNICLLFKRGINSEWDRGHGTPLSKDEAKELLRFANKNGLMHTSEEECAICNCDGCCCYPIRASSILGTKGLWPKQRYRVLWDESKCTNCGLCAKVCHFDAFARSDRKIVFNEELCLGCTLCKHHCPAKALSLEKIQ